MILGESSNKKKSEHKKALLKCVVFSWEISLLSLIQL